MSSAFTSKVNVFVAAAALIGFDANYLCRGGPAAQVWLAGAVAGHPAVQATRQNGLGRDGTRATWPDAVATSPRAEDLGTDVSRRVRLTWGCGGANEWREVETGSWRLTADVIEVCGRHEVHDGELRLNIRARLLVLNDAELVTESDGFVDLRARELVLNGSSRVTTRAPNSEVPPFASSANVSVSAEVVGGAGRLLVEAFGADYGQE